MNRRNFLKGALALVATPIVGTVVADNPLTTVPDGTLYFDIETNAMHQFDSGYFYAPYVPVVKSTTVVGADYFWKPPAGYRRGVVKL